MIPMDYKEVGGFEEVTVYDKLCLYTPLRIKRNSLPEGVFGYDVRHDDESMGYTCEVAPFILVNHFGTILTVGELDLGEGGRLYPRPEDEDDIVYWTDSKPVIDADTWFEAHRAETIEPVKFL